MEGTLRLNYARRVEAPLGFEPGMEVLQTSALPLGDGAGRNWGSKLTWNVRPRLLTQSTATSGRYAFEHLNSFGADTHQPRAERSRRRSGGVVNPTGAAAGRVIQPSAHGAESPTKRRRSGAGR